ncbi:MAG: helix-turn-helix transcriptional regulator [Methanobrevibacter sp.]|nr:helix-turn-helix transcriptional regulator [Methanobrevibacter sp.]
MTIGDEIRLRRTALGMAQYDLADALIVCPSTIYKWETGKSKPSFRKVLALAKIFGVSEQELLNPTPGEENEDSKNVP